MSPGTKRDSLSLLRDQNLYLNLVNVDLFTSDETVTLVGTSSQGLEKRKDNVSEGPAKGGQGTEICSKRPTTKGLQTGT